MLKKKIGHNFPRIIEVFTQKIVTKPSKIWVWDPRSGIRKKPIPDPGVKKAPDPGSRIRNTGRKWEANLNSWVAKLVERLLDTEALGFEWRHRSK